MFGPKREEVIGGWRRLHDEELHNFYASPNIIGVIKTRRMGMAGHVARMGGMRIAYSISAGKREERRPLRRHAIKWEDNIRMHLWEMR
jgi:hypothetical protein